MWKCLSALMVVGLFFGASRPADAEAAARDCLAAAHAMTGLARRNFLISCLQEGGTIACPAGKKLCGTSCIFRAKVCRRPAVRPE